MRKYLGFVSVFILLITFTVLQLGVGKIQGNLDMKILMLGVGTAVLAAVFSKGRLRKILLIVYGILFLVFILMVISFGVAHM